MKLGTLQLFCFRQIWIGWVDQGWGTSPTSSFHCSLSHWPAHLPDFPTFSFSSFSCCCQCHNEAYPTVSRLSQSFPLFPSVNSLWTWFPHHPLNYFLDKKQKFILCMGQCACFNLDMVYLKPSFMHRMFCTCLVPIL